jgi:hypothetical protein
MREYRSRARQVAGWAVLIAVLPSAGSGQARPVVSNQLAISQTEAALFLEFADRGTLEIVLGDGAVVIDGEAQGGFSQGDALDTAWRSLLGDIVSLSDGPLSEALRSWEAPSSLEDEGLALAQLLDRTLEDALTVVDASVSANSGPGLVIDATVPDLRRSLEALLSRRDLLGRLGEVLQAVDMATSRIHIGEDVVVSSNESVEGTMVVVDADARIEGLVEGDVVIVGGSLEVVRGGQVTGEIRLVDSSYEGVDPSTLGGRLIRIESDDQAVSPSAEVENLADLAGRIRREIRDELRDELRAELQEEFQEAGESDRGYRPLRAIGNGIGEVVGSVITFLLLSLLALGAVYFGKDNLEAVADAAQRNPMRAGMVGLAGTFLVLPTWVLGSVALVASVVGLIALPFWLVLFPVAVVLGAGLGYFAVAKNVGEWVASRNINGLEWLRPSNTLYAITAGIGTLLAFWVSASVLGMVPFFGFFSGLFVTLGTMASVAAVLIGFGAVLLTRGGRQPDFYGNNDPFEGGRWARDRAEEEVRDAEEFSGTAAGRGTGTGEETDV